MAFLATLPITIVCVYVTQTCASVVGAEEVANLIVIVLMLVPVMILHRTRTVATMICVTLATLLSPVPLLTRIALKANASVQEFAIRPA